MLDKDMSHCDVMSKKEQFSPHNKYDSVSVKSQVESLIESKPETEVELAPDGGWGWIVCISCFLCHAFTDGIFYSFGVVFVELLDYFGHGKGETAWISSLANGMCMFSGPFSAVLTNVFGCKVVTILGSFLLAGSFIISSFAPNIYFLYFSFGIMAGTGYGLVYLPSIVAVSMYFKKRRALATGIGVSGAGIGTFIFGPLANYLVHEYGWRGSMVIFGGICLNCLVCALTYRPLVESKHARQQKGHNHVRDVNHSQARAVKADEADTYCENLHDVINQEVGVEGGREIKNESDGDAATVDDEAYEDAINVKVNDSLVSNQSETLQMNKSLNIMTTSRTSLHIVYTDDSKTLPNVKSFRKELWNNVKLSLDPDMFRNIPFLLFLISTMLYSIGYYVPYIYLPDTAKVAGLSDKQGAWLVATIGITNTTGRIIFGAISDRKCINRLLLYSSALVVCGVATSLGPFFVSFPSLVIYAAVFGVSSGVTISLTSVIIADIVGIQKLAGAFGIINFFSGFVIVAGPPFVGWLFDMTGSYFMTYLVSGLTIACSGAMLYIIPCLKKTQVTDGSMDLTDEDKQ